MTLLSEHKVHQIILKLNKDIPRERALREFLDNATINGINRKEAILRIFEEYSNSNPIKIEKEEKQVKEELITLTKKELEELVKKDDKEEDKNELEIVKINKEVKNISEFDE